MLLLDHPLFARLLALLRRPAFAWALVAGLVISGVLAIPWFGGSEADRGRAPPAAEVEERTPASEAAPPETAGELPNAPEESEAAPAAEPIEVAALVPAEPPVYRPDAALAGGSLASVRSAPMIGAGVASELPEIRALGPEHVGATTSATPTLYWFLSGASSVPVAITLRSERAAEPLFELRLEPPIGAGLQALRLAPPGASLEPGVVHRWYVALMPEPANREADLVSGAAVLRTQPAGSLAEQLAAAPPAERAYLLAAAGYWYDAFDAITRRIQAEPGDERLREHRAALLEQVGLAGVAALIPAPLPLPPAAEP
jgi:hypothetical protein